jgi:hypothetical protein
MDKITLLRGRRELTFEKVPDKFVVRLQQGFSASSLEACCGVEDSEIEKLKYPIEGLDVYRAREPSKLDTIVDKLRASQQIDFVSNIYTLGETPNREVIPTGTLTVQFKPYVSKEEEGKILREFCLKVLNALEFLPNGYIVGPMQGSIENPLLLSAKLQQHKDIETAEPDLSFKIASK